MKQFLKVATLFFALSALCSCTCKNKSAIQVINAVNASKDYKLSCGQLEFAIEEARFFARSIDRKRDNHEAYSGHPLCYMPTHFQIVRATVAAEDRIDFLNTIYRQKNCSKQTSNLIEPDNIENTKLPLLSE